MTFEALQEFIDEQDQILIHAKETNQNERERVFVRTVKLGEEYGELCDAVLASVGDQRKDKLAESDRENLAGEFADVVIVTYLLAKSMRVDMSEALKMKIKKIREKHNTQL